MAELKPLGSEKLNGDDKLQRILELTYYKNTNNKSTQPKAELVSEAKTGGVYGIVKEKDAYYVKRGLNESSLDYIGGMFMKNKNKFSSYSEALKRLELLKGQEELHEATKYVLKTNKPQEESPITPESTVSSEEPMSPDEVGDVPAPSAGMGDVPTDDVEMTPETPTGKPSDYMSEVQKYSGKLGQELRDTKEQMESDDIKYVLNMIISAVDLNKLDIEDLEDIAKKFEREELPNDDELPSDEPSSDDELPTDEPSSEDELGENDAMDSLESFINTPIDSHEEIDLSKYADLGEENDVQEIDLDEIKNEINRTVGETLSKYFK
jgi:hypothetical protein